MSTPGVRRCWKSISILLVLLACWWQAFAADGASHTAEEHSFQAVHLLWIDTHQENAEARLRRAIAALNEAIRKAGCAACSYRLWRVTEGSPGGYNYMQISEWPSNAEYTRIHTTPEYLAASQAWASLRSVITREVYVRQSELPLDEQSGAVATLTGNDGAGQPPRP